MDSRKRRGKSSFSSFTPAVERLKQELIKLEAELQPIEVEYHNAMQLSALIDGQSIEKRVDSLRAEFESGIRDDWEVVMLRASSTQPLEKEALSLEEDLHQGEQVLNECRALSSRVASLSAKRNLLLAKREELVKQLDTAEREEFASKLAKASEFQRQKKYNHCT